MFIHYCIRDAVSSISERSCTSRAGEAVNLRAPKFEIADQYTQFLEIISYLLCVCKCKSIFVSHKDCARTVMRERKQ